jgi:hypothetical protein
VGRSIVSGVQSALGALPGIVSGLVSSALAGIGGKIRSALSSARGKLPFGAPLPPGWEPGPGETLAARARAPGAYAAAGEGTLAGLAGGPSFAQQVAAAMRAAPLELAAAAAAPVTVNVYIGERELSRIVRSEVVSANTGLARTLLAGARR